jgi:hypothetical protein
MPRQPCYLCGHEADVERQERNLNLWVYCPRCTGSTDGRYQINSFTVRMYIRNPKNGVPSSKATAQLSGAVRDMSARGIETPLIIDDHLKDPSTYYENMPRNVIEALNRALITMCLENPDDGSPIDMSFDNSASISYSMDENQHYYRMDMLREDGLIRLKNPLAHADLKKKFSIAYILLDGWRKFERIKDYEDNIEVTETEIDAEVDEREYSGGENPIVFVEGRYDRRYIEKAASLLGKQDLIKNIELNSGGGHGGLDAIWRQYHNVITKITSQKILLIYDPEMNRPNGERGLVNRGAIPLQTENPVFSGIENIFSVATLQRVQNKFPNIFKVETRQDGICDETRTQYIINRNQKGNLCDELCESGNKKDFSKFELIFKIIEDFLSPK